MRSTENIKYEVEKTDITASGEVVTFTRADGSKFRSLSIKNPELLKKIAILAEGLSLYERSLVSQIIDI